ncbi:MAG TPA: biopolymer transporter ExbD [Chthoniobacterales bacterium]|jgi:biopolymer transport protein ExbD
MGGSVGSEDGDVGFQIAPMVDVVFVLLLFFMAMAGTQQTELELSINLPGGTTPGREAPTTTPIIIDINQDDSIVVNGKTFDSPTTKNLVQLQGWLTETIKMFGGKDPVIIRPSMETAQERIIDVLNAAAAAKVTNLSFG